MATINYVRRLLLEAYYERRTKVKNKSLLFKNICEEKYKIWGPMLDGILDFKSFMQAINSPSERAPKESVNFKPKEIKFYLEGKEGFELINLQIETFNLNPDSYF